MSNPITGRNPPETGIPPGWSLVDPRRDPAWATLAAGPTSSLFGSPPWISAIADTYAFDITAAVHVEGGQPTAGLASAMIDDLRGARIVSLPFCDHLDPTVDGDAEWDELVAPLLAREVPVQLRVLASQAPRRDPHFHTVGELLWHATDLRRPFDDVVGGFSAKARQGARSARRQGVTVSFGDRLDDVRTFHDLHRETRKRKYRLLAQPISFFEHIWERFSPIDGVVVGLAHHHDEVIGGALYLFWSGVMYYKFGASKGSHLSLRPNDLLAVESIRLGCERGACTYDWGVSDLDQPGLFSFKRKYATDEGKVSVLRHTPAVHGHDGVTGAGALLGELTALLTGDDVPDDVTQRAGELLYQYFC